MAVVGATFAYFTATVNDTYSSGGNGQTTVSSAKVASTMTFAQADQGAGKFTAENVYPGHKEVAAIKVTAQGEEGSQSAVQIAYSVTENDFAQDALKISVYRSDSQIDLENKENAFSCVQKSGTATEPGKTKLYEECTGTTAKLVGARMLGKEQSIPQNDGSIILVDRDTIDASSSGTDVYYYVVVEFKDTNADQTEDNTGKTLDGEISIVAA